ncbi:M14 family metallocarboxypeptidase [Paraglaciecola aquimarina]|uniref:M14 family metallocarboxypeptidase n=1 Tax=Paraglaciecola aquimarina TaxID=1235557 RepID=A0ABU3SU52_9ALTE|nr:M14 family metallocarboxypeptidase [Paraglaciecola aquimarina]MDU0353529.1 M14 family metallocarboxypeptidase [Paraglaciecola aquimarina]
MHITYSYPIGTTGVKWTNTEKAQWLALQCVKRSYADDVLSQINSLAKQFTIKQYANLRYDSTEFPLFYLSSVNWDKSKPNVLITGGVHGYETSGIFGALRFADSAAQQYHARFNLMIVPCVSPWAYQTINRWNPNAIDPNRSFYPNSPAPESAALMGLVKDLDFIMHIDLHETTDTDNSEFRPALSARDAVEHKEWAIPDGFYTVGDTIKPNPEFQKAIIESVEKVTHIAPADGSGRLIGEVIQQKGVINYATKALGLCAGLTDAKFVSTTEVYPDSPKVDGENCIQAQVAAITGALDFVSQY